MSLQLPRINPCLWFDDRAEDAVRLYTSVFDNSRVITSTRYNKESAEASGRPDGSIMTIAFELDGQRFTALNGGPHFKFNEAVSLVVNCGSQREVDHFWNNLGEGGDPKAQQCGWLKDRFGVSWQIVPTALLDLLADRDPKNVHKVTAAMLKMKKLDIEGLRRAID